MTSRYLFISLLATMAASAVAEDVLFRDDFSNMDLWKPLLFPKIEAHTQYEIVENEGASLLKASANASASGLVLKRTFDVTKYPVIKWRWKVGRVLKKGDATKKSGDDYAARVYIIFEYDPKTAKLATRAKYGLAKKLYGEYPPHSSLNYIWANRKHEAEVIVSPYTSLSRMIPLRWGPESVGKWEAETVNILEDYKKAFGGDPPRKASLAIMSDADNTKESTAAYFDYIEVSTGKTASR